MVPTWLLDTDNTGSLGIHETDMVPRLAALGHLQQAEVMEFAWEILQNPKTHQVDNHTLVFIFLADFTVKGEFAFKNDELCINNADCVSKR